MNIENNNLFKIYSLMEKMFLLVYVQVLKPPYCLMTSSVTPSVSKDFAAGMHRELNYLIC